jgi:hypothetical protein
LKRVTAGHAKASDGANMPMQVSVTGSPGLAWAMLVVDANRAFRPRQR